MMFYISPRGEGVQGFQKDIYAWNHQRISEHLDNLNFKYRIAPFASNSQPNGIPFNHSKAFEENDFEQDDLTDKLEEKLQQKLESAIVSIYYYDRSYFKSMLPSGVIPRA
jgi:hypothetical protein